MITLTTKHQRYTTLLPLSPELVANLAAAWDVRMVNERSSLDCGSLLPLSAMQPAPSRTALARKIPDEPSACPPRSRLHWGRLQQALAVQGLQQKTRARSISGITKLIQPPSSSTDH